MSAAWASTLTVAASSSDSASHGVPLVNPAVEGSAVQRIGVRIRSSGLVPVIPISSP